MAVVVLYPCSQFGHLTSGRTEVETQELFEAWIAAHHPALFDMEKTMPRWETASYPPFDLQQDIVIVPPCCESFWNEDWEKQTTDCTLVRNAIRRDEIVQQILAARNYSEHPFDDEFIIDCYALAFARLLIDLLNQNLNYLQTPDVFRLKSLMIDAIQAARNNEPGDQHRAMQSAFDEIAMAKDSYHPTQNYFIELTLVTKTMLGEPLRQLLLKSRQINLFMPNALLATLPETHPDTFSQLKWAVEQNKVRFIVDDAEPQSLALLPILDVADQILEGISVYRELLNISPKVYGRLTIGLTPALPQLLKLADVTGALHFAPLDGWKIKEDDQSKILWQGLDNTSIDALVRYPIDASKYLSFFEFADQFSSQISVDNVPSSILALFPGQKSAWLDILRRMTRFTLGLGKFVDIEEYCGNTSYFGGLQRYDYERYPVNALTETVQNPILHWNERYKVNTDRLVQSALETLLQLLNPTIQLADTPSLTQKFVEAILPASDRQEPMGKIIVNPLSFARKMFVDDVAVDVPPLGYAYVGKESGDCDTTRPRLFGIYKAKNNSTPVLARQATDDLRRREKRTVYLLENRYFSAKFDAVTGMLRSIFTNRSRFNQLSRQIAFRKDQTYSVQAADEMVITKATSEIGQLRISGRLVCPVGELAARFTETVTIRSQSRLLEFDLMLEPVMEMEDDRWNSYIAVRHAWNEDTLNMCGGFNDGVHKLPDRKYLHSPRFIDLRSETQSLTFLSEGLPFHRRSGERQLDTLLIVKGETQRLFRLGIAVNAQHPAFLSYDFLLGQEGYIFPAQCRPKNPSVWLFQIASNHVMALYWEPLLESDKLVGYTVYLQETEGRGAHFTLHSFLSPKHATAVDFQGKERKTFKVDGDAVLIDMRTNELLPLRVRIV